MSLEKAILDNLIGKRIESIDYNGLYSAPITIHFTDGTVVTVDAEGDDMTHTILHYKDNSIVTNNLLNDSSYTPYCGNHLLNRCSNPRSKWDNIKGQFVCPECGWISDFPKTFINLYKVKHNK